MSEKEKVLRKKPTEIAEAARQVWLAGMGALATAEEEGSRLFGELVKRGEQMEHRGVESGKKARRSLEEGWEKLGDNLDERVRVVLKHLNVPTREEVDELSKQMKKLAKKLDEMREPVSV